ncbi:MAG: response regulator transcription factor [Chitinophaga sp.]|uniref:response regulator transcription factor n=1 Tax=Chitinophaga sp. TaxID=1869181 RepID=UPI001B2E534C|nr:response regulator transcription factor [Chitinophaga sp.]MBO9729575.1 response regulator transcription factor [Chitinophaga sp.]
MPDKKTIVIVDDHTMFRRGLKALIDFFEDYTVLFDAANGRDFIRQLKPDSPPDIVLLDITMPEMDGYETAAWLQNHHPDIAVLALSTMDSETAIIRMIRQGVKGYILKDADPLELKFAFNEVLTQGYFFNDLVTRKVMRSINQLVQENDKASQQKITDREKTFLKLACSEKSYNDIAKEMFLSERTIDGYREALFKKFGVSTRVGLVIYAIKNQLVQL